ncbi:MAG: ATP-dependent Clp protease ATP-binding subunit, partial [Methanococcaceae archaeon]
FNPEFLNRIDEAIVFRNLEKEDIIQIINIEIKDLLENIKQNKMEIILEQSAKDYIATKGYDPKYGARPLRRAIQKYIEDPLAEEILKGTFKEGSKILVKHLEGTEELYFENEAANEVSDEEKERTGSNEA